jgi:tetratricopeptide (TPR) repeat protein
MKKITRILFFVTIPLICLGEPQSDEEIDRLINFHTFNAEWTIADSLLDAQIAKYPDSPKYYALKSPFYFYTRYFNNGVLNGDSLMELVAQYSQKAIDTGEKSEMTIDDKFFVGSAYGYLARYYGRQGEFWDAYWAARSTRRCLNDVLEENPEYADAYMELAVMEYFTSRMGGFYRFLAWMVGMAGERDTALEQFHTVADKGHWCKDEAQFALSTIYRFFENIPQQAQSMTTILVDKFPDNPFLENQDRQLRFLSLIEEKGIEFLSTEFDSLETKYSVTNPGILNGFGYTLIGQNRLEEAIEVFKINIRLYPDIANGYDSISEAYLITGNTEMAIHYSRLCLQKIAADSTLNDVFRELLNNTSEERLEELGAKTEKLNI